MGEVEVVGRAFDENVSGAGGGVGPGELDAVAGTGQGGEVGRGHGGGGGADGVIVDELAGAGDELEVDGGVAGTTSIGVVGVVATLPPAAVPLKPVRLSPPVPSTK